MKSLLTPEALARAAFLLMSSSAQGRYRRMARQIAEEEALTSQLSEDPALVRRAFDRVSTLWSELIGASTRDVQEFEVAVLLAALAAIDAVGIEAVLHEIEASRRSSTIWLEGLARHLLAELHDKRLAAGVVDWMARTHNDVPAFEPDALARAQMEAA